jgi:hypothetical protein
LGCKSSRHNTKEEKEKEEEEEEDCALLKAHKP